jgi:hypothetical protein
MKPSSFYKISKPSQADTALTTETMNRNVHIFPAPSEATLE